VQSQRVQFEDTKVESLLAIIVDMSGSFADSWEGRAHRLFLNLMDKFFKEGAGAESRVVLGQLSANNRVVLFEGAPSELRGKFPTPESLNSFLRANSDPNGSPVFEATGRTLDYLNGMSGVDDSTRKLTVILSDLADSEPDPERRRTTGNAMLTSLKRYQQSGGALGLYFVAPEETSRWRVILDQANFEPGQAVIETSIRENPPLPSFD